MQRVLILDTNKKPLMPTHPAKARKLLKAGKAAVYRRYPFTIILNYAIDNPCTQPIELKIDPGSKTTGMSIVAQFTQGWVVLWAANLYHRGHIVEIKLRKRRQQVRRGRRSRLRYRKPRWGNRSRTSFEYIDGVKVARRHANNKQAKQGTGRPSGWISPSLQSRVDNVYHWTRRLIGCTPVDSIHVETVRFDTHKLINPEVTGVEYQRGDLFGYEVKEYLLEKFNRTCVYCGAKNVPFEVEHVIPKSMGGSNRVANLVLACVTCNRDKGSLTAAEYGHPDIQKKANERFSDAAAVNSTRYAIGGALKSLGLPVSFWSGGRTKHNRIKQGYLKDHWVDSACVGEDGYRVRIPAALRPLKITAKGRGKRQMQDVNKQGFPRIKRNGDPRDPDIRQKPKQKQVHGFQSNDIVRACPNRGRWAGRVFVGPVTVRQSGAFKLVTPEGVVSTSYKNCTLLQKSDGYTYDHEVSWITLPKTNPLQVPQTTPQKHKPVLRPAKRRIIRADMYQQARLF